MSDDKLDREAWETSISLITAFLSPQDDDAAVRILYDYLEPSVVVEDGGGSVDASVFITRTLRLIHILAQGMAQAIALQALQVGADPAEMWASSLTAAHGSGVVDMMWDGDVEGALEALKRMFGDDPDSA